MFRPLPASLTAAIAAALALSACGEAPRIPGVTPHRIEIQQGNLVTQEMVSQLKPGMSKEQVRFVLGTPLVTDIFHADRWDYVYLRELPGGKREQRRLAVHFEDGRLARVDGDVMPAAPASKEVGKAVAEPEKKPVVEPEKKPATEAEKKSVAEEPQRGLFDRILEKLGF